MARGMISIGLFFLGCLWATAQDQPMRDDSTAVLIGGQLHYGSILPHTRSISHLTGDWFPGFQLDISRIRYTEDSWSTCNCFSQNGLSLSYFRFNDPKVLGGAISLAVFAEPRITYGRLHLSLRAGAGLSYLTRVFDPEENPENLFFSTPLSGLLLAQISGRYQINTRWSLRAGASYHHISNGGRRQPNNGMNFPSIDVGIDYALQYAAHPPRQKAPLTDRSMKYYAGIFFNSRSVDESDFEDRTREPVLGLQAGIYKPVARLHAVGAAIELSHDGALRERARLKGTDDDHHVISLLLRHHFLFGRFDFSQALGVYVHKEYDTPDDVFQRYSLAYMVFQKLKIGFSLKAHLHTAEQMDVRLAMLL